MVSRAWVLAVLACKSLAVINRQPARGLLIPGTKVQRMKRGVFDKDNADLSYKMSVHLVDEDLLVEMMIGTTVEFVKIDTVDSRLVVFGPNCTTCPGLIKPWEPDDVYEDLPAEESVAYFNEGGCRIHAGKDSVWDPEGSLAEKMEIWVATECQFEDPSRKVKWAGIAGLGVPSCAPGHQKDASKMHGIRGLEAAEAAEGESERADGPHPRNPQRARGWHRRMAERRERQQRQQREREERERNHDKTWHPLGMATDDSLDPPDHPAKPAGETEEEWESHTPAEVIKAPYPHSKLPAKAPAREAPEELDVACSDSTLLRTWGLERFSLCMHEGHDAWGSLTVNGADPAKNPKVMQHPLAGRNFWAVRISDFHFRKDGRPFGETLGLTEGGVAILDSTSVALGVPHYLFVKMEAVWRKHALDCYDMSLQISLGFNMGESKEDVQGIRLGAKAWLAQRYGMTTADVAGDKEADGTSKPVPEHDYAGPFIGCESMIQDLGEAKTDTGDLIVLGLPFFQQYFTTFHSPPGGAHFITAQHANEESCDPKPIVGDQEDPELSSQAGARTVTKRRAVKDLPLPRYAPLNGEILRV